MNEYACNTEIIQYSEIVRCFHFIISIVLGMLQIHIMTLL